MKKFVVGKVKKVCGDYGVYFKAHRSDIGTFDATSYRDYGVCLYDSEAEAKEHVESDMEMVILEDI